MNKACIYKLVNTSLIHLNSTVVTSVAKFTPLSLVFTFKDKILKLSNTNRLNKVTQVTTKLVFTS